MVTFLNPWLLAGLAAAAIPILLHLIARRRPPTVVFPAVRYLVDTRREHHRRLRVQHWLLLLVRTLLIAFLVLAAAAPMVRTSSAGGHAPSALVLIVDNSPSSGVVAGGVQRLGTLQAAARAVLDRATPADALWLLAADGAPRRGDAESLRRMVDALEVDPRRLDLGRAIELAAEVLATDDRSGEIVVVSDLQATALSTAEVDVPLVIARPREQPPANRGVATLSAGPQPWPLGGGRVSLSLIGDSSGATAPVTVQLGDAPGRQVLATVDGIAELAVDAPATGWWELSAAADPDEFRLDDRRVAAVRVAPVARADWSLTGRWASAAAEVLASNGRLAAGNEITLGGIGPGASVVEPPADPAAAGALNRALERRGASWRFGTEVAAAETSDSGAVVARHRITRRYALEPSGSGRTGVLATVGGAPWIVRTGDLVLLGSRLEPEWTELPVSAAFVPFLDVMLNRIARGEVALAAGSPGDPVTMPDHVTEVRRDTLRRRVEGGGRFRPPATGVYWLTSGEDTVGALAVNPDPRESRLDAPDDAAVRRLWPGAWVRALEEAGDAAFASAARRDLRTPLLLGVVLLGMVEVGLASAGRGRK